MDKIVCLGKNYSEHVREMQRLSGDAPPTRPVLFLKPPSSLLDASSPKTRARLPAGRGEVHPECEIVLRLSRGGYRLSEEEALTCLGDATLGLDLTLRDVQGDLKKAGHPWEVAKVFPDSAIVGPWIEIGGSSARLLALMAAEFRFSVQGEVRQRGRGADMTYGPAQAIAYASSFFELKAGDLIFTGTPAGVSAVVPGQSVLLEWDAGIAFELDLT